MPLRVKDKPKSSDSVNVENSAISRGATDRRLGVCRLTKRSKPLVHRRGRE